MSPSPASRRTAAVEWATSISADGRVVGAEVVTSPHEGVLFAVNGVTGGLRVGSPENDAIDADDGVLLVEYLSDGSVAMAAAVRVPRRPRRP